MSASLVATGLAAAHGDRPLFADLDLVVAGGDVIGLVGDNGAGKSTLLQMLAGLRLPDAGTVLRNPSDAEVGYLPQERVPRPGETMSEFFARRTGVADALAEMDTAAAQLADGIPGADGRYSDALERWLHLGGADLDDRAGAVAAGLGLTLDLGTDMRALSGGQSARAALASLLLSRFDVVLLDEPTNDLDLDGLEVLEGTVTALRSPMVIVSHDREFLSRTVTSVVEHDHAQQKIRQVSGGYHSYLAEREVARRHEREAFEQYAGRRDELLLRGRTQRAWMEKGVANARRKAPDNDKSIKHFRGETAEKQAAKARQTDRMIERLEEVAEPRKEWELRMEIALAPRSGVMSAFAADAVVERGAFTLGPVSLQIDWQDRVAITGPNGSGKTTLLGLLLGRIVPTTGTAGVGSGIVVGEVDQARALLSGDATLASAIGAQLTELNDADVRTLLAKFGLKGDRVLRPSSTLSPGERTRAALALLQGRGVNLLVLDEPTNHLDLQAIEQLEAALDSFTATMLLVTHDRAMLKAVRTTRHLAVDSGRVTEL